MLDAVANNSSRHTYISFSRMLRAATNAELPAATARIRQLQRGANHPAVAEMPFISGGAAATWQSTATHFHSFGNVTVVTTYLPGTMGFVAEDAVAVQKLLGNLAGGPVTQLNATDMKNLYGYSKRLKNGVKSTQWISVTDVVRGTAMFGRIVKTDLTYMAGSGADIPRLLDQMYEVPGLASAAGVYLCRSGTGWGARLEIKALATRIINNVEPENMRMSLPMVDRHLGPDLAEFVLRNANVVDDYVIDLWQCKALQDFGAFAGDRATNEVLRQLFSDLSRFGADGWQGAAKGAADAFGNKADLSGRYFPAFDFNHWWTNVKVNPVVQVRNVVEQFGGTLTIPANATVGEVRRLLAEGMHFAMAQKSAQLSQTVAALSETGPLTPIIRNNLTHIINSRIYRRYPKGAKPARLDLSEIGPLTLVREGFIKVSEYTHFAELAPDEFLRLATQRAMGLDAAKLAAMPAVNVDMKLVVEGVSQRGIFNPSIPGQL